jgi:hypothetical protein
MGLRAWQFRIQVTGLQADTETAHIRWIAKLSPLPLSCASKALYSCRSGLRCKRVCCCRVLTESVKSI